MFCIICKRRPLYELNWKSRFELDLTYRNILMNCSEYGRLMCSVTPECYVMLHANADRNLAS